MANLISLGVRLFVLMLLGVGGGAAGAQRGRPVVAVYEVRDMAGTGQSAAFTTMIETAITSTSKFRVIERKFDRLVAEQQAANSGIVTTNTPGRIGGFEGADFLIYGAITTASSSRKTDTGASIGRALVGGMLSGNMGRGGGLLGGGRSTANCSKTTASLTVDIKIVDAKTGEARYATRINQSADSSSSCSGDTQIDTASLLRVAADKIAAGLVTTIFPIQIAAVQSEGTIVLNYGEGTVTPGALMAVFAKAEAILDPATGERLSDEGAQIGTIRITEVMPRISKAVAASAFTQAPTIGAIVRPAPAPARSNRYRR